MHGPLVAHGSLSHVGWHRHRLPDKMNQVFVNASHELSTLDYQPVLLRQSRPRPAWRTPLMKHKKNTTAPSQKKKNPAVLLRLLPAVCPFWPTPNSAAWHDSGLRSPPPVSLCTTTPTDSTCRASWETDPLPLPPVFCTLSIRLPCQRERETHLGFLWNANPACSHPQETPSHASFCVVKKEKKETWD